jgi:hypothetical protein
MEDENKLLEIESIGFGGKLYLFKEWPGLKLELVFGDQDKVSVGLDYYSIKRLKAELDNFIDDERILKIARQLK